MNKKGTKKGGEMHLRLLTAYRRGYYSTSTIFRVIDFSP